MMVKMKNLKEKNTKLYDEVCCYQEDLECLKQENEILKEERNLDNVKFFTWC